VRHAAMLGTGILAGLAFTRFVRSSSAFSLNGKTVLITGGSRGLGLLLASEFARRGARVAISARDPEELQRAAEKLRSITDEVFTVEADHALQEEAELAVERVSSQFGRIDVLVNNAGKMTVGPLESMTVDDFRDSLNVHFWGSYFTTMAVLPKMRQGRGGRIVNISSIGGRISVPHLVPYSVGKFALTGFSEGLRAELRKDKIMVTTVCPGLMRTGSARNASFKGNNEAEYAWFSASASLPGLSIPATDAACAIVDACRRGQAEVVLSIPAKVASLLHGVMPGAMTDLLGLANRVLPGPGGIGRQARTGAKSSANVASNWVTKLNDEAAAENNEVA
jgi:NAD(P)-dependent dehydrogenase (short-subunit alcohol dehydrogenase family)